MLNVMAAGNVTSTIMRAFNATGWGASWRRRCRCQVPKAASGKGAGKRRAPERSTRAGRTSVL
jgi:hypothetical protein